ncbi:tyrosine--tRNA ligase [Candidatus Uhrbacteria bacterium RIFOXYC2_FULL_47_19]|uniref:Tyrosine--tRNA ligase n=1 Tax=Candidatus Uhrbacteria bacterium RIFOXYC2_FULL_47_19 TaxID=1802424 RepID=A0A1F7WGJ3_9BACT|nr:MAG: tyrosine--tRNA ligase [Candidatus Uhrbacteria bacterium RIFOXYC2_FULL_47_19]
MTSTTDPNALDQLMSRRVTEIISVDSLKEKLALGRPLRIKFGADPTAPDLHLGHVVPLKKLREFQDLGHTVVLIIGDYTALVGDPSGKSKTRPMLTEEEVQKNAETYLLQVGRILDVTRLEVRRNSEWFAKMSFTELIQVAAKFTVARMIERDDFEKRLKGGMDVHLHELLYPMMQAYDSVMVEADVEIGGTDQRFNILAGRELQRKMELVQQDILLLGPILVGTDGVQKMSKSLDNYIGVEDDPSDMYGKVMSIPDSALWDYWTLVTDEPDESIAEMRTACESGKMNPRDAKARLARAIVTELHSSAAADEAESRFETVFRQGGKPEEIPELAVEDGITLVDVLVMTGFVTSKGEARRVIEQGGVKVDDQVITDINALVDIKDGGTVIQKGKRHFVRLIKK